MSQTQWDFSKRIASKGISLISLIDTLESNEHASEGQLVFTTKLLNTEEHCSAHTILMIPKTNVMVQAGLSDVLILMSSKKFNSAEKLSIFQLN